MLLCPLLPDPDALDVVEPREVPLTEVVALEETPVLPLVLERTVAFELVTDDGDSDDV